VIPPIFYLRLVCKEVLVKFFLHFQILYSPLLFSFSGTSPCRLISADSFIIDSFRVDYFQLIHLELTALILLSGQSLNLIHALVHDLLNYIYNCVDILLLMNVFCW
jgi:hypothetical protein